jgi:hypothetical protein
LEISPGVIASHASQTVIILEPIGGSQVRVRDVATGTETSYRSFCESSFRHLDEMPKEKISSWREKTRILKAKRQ